MLSHMYYRMLISIREYIMPRALLIFITASKFSFLFVFRIWSNFLSFSVDRAYSSCFFNILKSNSSAICYFLMPWNILNMWMTILTAWFLSYITKYLISYSSRSWRLSTIFLYCSFITRHLYHKNSIYCWFISLLGLFNFFAAKDGFSDYVFDPYT